MRFGALAFSLAVLPLLGQSKIASITPPMPEKTALISHKPFRTPSHEAWLTPLDRRETAALRSKGGLPLSGIHREVPTAIHDGGWDSSGVWRASIRSPQAEAIRVHFTDFNAGAGNVWLYMDDQVAGPYTGRGIHNDGEFWSAALTGEQISIAYEPAPGAEGALPFRIAEISHFFEAPVKAATAPPAALQCNVDATCRPAWSEAARSVARIAFETGGGSFLCSGALLNTRNQSLIPYFLTADHCISTDAEARTVEAYWRYETSTCNGQPPAVSSVPRTLGARYMAGGSMSEGDFTLLRLNSVPGGVTFSGWSAQELALGADVTGIHHPGGDYKRISFGQRAQPVATRGRPESLFYTINWREGVTEGGSSGSPIFNASGQVVGMLSGGPKPDAGKTECDLTPAYDFYGRFQTAFTALQPFLEDRAGPGTGGGGTTQPPTGSLLASGTPQRISLSAISSGTLFSGARGYRIEVPQGATRLEITLNTSTPNADVDLYASFGSEPSVVSGRVQADFSSTSDTGNERIVITSDTRPALQAGTYYIALALFTYGVTVDTTLTATVSTPGTPAPSGAPAVLTPGVARSFTLPAVSSSTLFSGEYGFQITVPAGATKLRIQLTTATPGVDLDLFARAGTEPSVSGGKVVSDYDSSSPGGDELITVTLDSSPPLRAGVYYIAFAQFTKDKRTEATVVATVETPLVAPSGPTLLRSGVPASFTLPAVDNPTLYIGDYGFRITVPEGATSLNVRLNTTTPNADLDLYVRADADVDLADGEVLADFYSESDSGNESITITRTSSPQLKPGTYFVGLGVFAQGVVTSGTVTATIERAPGAAPSGVGQLVRIGEPVRYSFPAVTDGTLFTGSSMYRLEAANINRLEIRIKTDTPGADVDLFVRYGVPPTVENGHVVSDFSSTGDTGDELVVIQPGSSSPLRSGVYYIAMAVFTKNTPVTGTLLVTEAPAQTEAALEPKRTAPKRIERLVDW
jgi:hypothetical protein